MDFKDRLTKWVLGFDRGMSSEAIFFYMTLGITEGEIPYDPSDLGRCLRLLELFPEWKPRMNEMAKISLQWAALVSRWDELEKTLLSEVNLTGGGRAPKTYKMMKDIIDSVNE